MKRLFIAVKVELNAPFLDLTSRLRNGCRFDKIAWTDPSLMHLTLKFLGKTPDMQIPKIEYLLQELTTTHSSFEMQLDKLGVFGSRYAPSVLWYGFSTFTHFKALFNDLETKLNTIGVEPLHGNFVPHITVARIKKVDDKKHFWNLIEQSNIQLPQIIAIDHLILYQSKLTTQGPLYKELYKVSF